MSRTVKLSLESDPAGYVIRSNLQHRRLYKFDDGITYYFELAGRWENRAPADPPDAEAVTALIADLRLQVAGESLPLSRAGKKIATVLRDPIAKMMKLAPSSYGISDSRPLLIIQAQDGNIRTSRAVERAHSVNLKRSRLACIGSTFADAYLLAQHRAVRPTDPLPTLLERLHLERVTSSLLARHALAGGGAGLQPLATRRILMRAASYLSKHQEDASAYAAVNRTISYYKVRHPEFERRLTEALELSRDQQLLDILAKATIYQFEGDQIMGDKFEGISNSTITNRSTVVTGNNVLLSGALDGLQEMSESVKDAQLSDRIDDLKKEIESSGGPTNNSKSMWEAIKQSISIIGPLASSAGAVEQFFQNL